MTSVDYRICTNCVMDTSDSKIRFGPDGVCDHCQTFYAQVLPSWDTGERGRATLERLAAEIKKQGVGRDFDCIIGVSGGIDSSYLTYVAKEQLGLRPLVFHVDAGWNSQIAVNNIEKLVDGLGLDLYTEVIDWEEMRDLQLAFFKSGVPHIDTPQDHAFFATMYKFAEQHRVRYILTGANLSTECIRNPDRVDVLPIGFRAATRHPSAVRNAPATQLPDHEHPAPQGLSAVHKGIRVVRPLNYVPYVKEDAMQLLHDKFGWQPYPAQALRIALHALLRGLLAADEIRLRHAARAVLEPDPDQADDSRGGARETVATGVRRRHDRA